MSAALTYLNRPFAVFVENSRADRYFINAFMTHEERRHFGELVEKGWVQIVHGGGLGDLKRQVEEEFGRANGANLRAFSLFDSEAVVPGQPCADSVQLKETCQRLGMKHLQLARRAIENYLPSGALAMWCHSLKRTKRLGGVLRSFLRMNRAQKSHFNMKGGFKADRKHNSSAGTLFNNLDAKQLAELELGFGSRVARCFERPELVPKRELEEDGGWPEVRPAIGTMFSMI